MQKKHELSILHPDARQCGRCGAGPVMLAGCEDLTTHHGQVMSGPRGAQGDRPPVDNSCGRCAPRRPEPSLHSYCTFPKPSLRPPCALRAQSLRPPCTLPAPSLHSPAPSLHPPCTLPRPPCALPALHPPSLHPSCTRPAPSLHPPCTRPAPSPHPPCRPSTLHARPAVTGAGGLRLTSLSGQLGTRPRQRWGRTVNSRQAVS